ncbi:hypothetical protein IE81DRAFT_130207 [Ceraceosorus guamensis]|uniref:Uncharacterized protein n=1 Tax=Ceraceosorus guamensis TaxID=1522189 RepID=A0A316WA09_9BASI|nr:hypothetical protein IE81DRAFT_130207 [Ceraceosorus guamensis]PWN45908.1 hypothetical protein IE81DRAFT_130207 [Ceraceosorus guamensis]
MTACQAFSSQFSGQSRRGLADARCHDTARRGEALGDKAGPLDQAADFSHGLRSFIRVILDALGRGNSIGKRLTLSTAHTLVRGDAWRRGRLCIAVIGVQAQRQASADRDKLPPEVRDRLISKQQARESLRPSQAASCGCGRAISSSQQSSS